MTAATATQQRTTRNAQYLAPLIWAALGGKETLEKCLGARDFTECGNAVYFKVKPKGKINAIRIVTDGNGLFTLQYMHVYSDVKAGFGESARSSWADELNTMKRLCADEMVLSIDAVFCPIIENSLMYAIVDTAPIADEPVLVAKKDSVEYAIPPNPEIILDTTPEKADIVDKETKQTTKKRMVKMQPLDKTHPIFKEFQVLQDKYNALTEGQFVAVIWHGVPISDFVELDSIPPINRPDATNTINGVKYVHKDFLPAPPVKAAAKATKPDLIVEVLPIHKQILAAITDGHNTPELLAGYLFLDPEKIDKELAAMVKFALIENEGGVYRKVGNRKV